jgi:hypothetical protein
MDLLRWEKLNLIFGDMSVPGFQHLKFSTSDGECMM